MEAEDAVRAADSAFRAAFGEAPEGVWMAPGRVNLIGEHTDYQFGLCLPMAIDRQVVAAARRRGDDRLRAHSTAVNDAAEVALSQLEPGPRGDWFNYVAGVAAELQPPGGLDLCLVSDLPLGAGLSSSAALEVATAVAINDLWDLGRQSRELALAAQRAEHRFAGAQCGIMDQFAAVFGQHGHALLLDTLDQTIHAIPFAPESASLALWVIDTRAPHQVIGGGYEQRVSQAAAAAAALGLPHLRAAQLADVEALPDPVLRRRARHIVTENARVMAVAEAADRGDWAAIGQALYASHRSLAEDYAVSHPALDAVVQCAQQIALGARLTGAGFGGSAIVLLAAGAEEAFLTRLRATYQAQGWAPFAAYRVRTAQGARRLA